MQQIEFDKELIYEAEALQRTVKYGVDRFIEVTGHVPDVHINTITHRTDCGEKQTISVSISISIPAA